MKDTVTPGNPAVQREGRARQAHEHRHGEPELGRRVPLQAAGARRRRTWSATPATPRGPRAAAAATCRSRPTGRPRATTTRAARRAITRPTTRRSRATTCSCSGAARPRRAARSRHSGRAPRWCCRPPTRTASASTCSRRRSPRAAYSSQAFNAALSAHRAQGRDQDLRRLPYLGEQRQQRHHGAAADVRDQFRQFRRLQRLCRRRRRAQCGHGHRVGRAAGGDRQLPAPLCLPGLVRRSSRSAIAALQHATPALGRAMRSACSCAANICTSPKAVAACASTTLPASPTRACPRRIVTAPVQSAGRQHPHRLERCDLRGAADQPADQSGAQCRRQDAGGQPGVAVPSDLRLRLHHRRAAKA